MGEVRNNLKMNDCRGQSNTVKSSPNQQAAGHSGDHHIIEQRKKAELQRKNEENLKMFSIQNIRNRFEEVTERKNINTTVKNMADAGMQAVYYDLENRRDRLRKLLKEEEACYKRERQERVGNMGQNTNVEKQSLAQDQRRQREEERKKLVEEKRMQQFLNNYEPMRTLFTKKNDKQTFCAQLDQLKELECQRNKELAEKLYWEETDRKSFEKKTRDEITKNRESKKKMQDIAKEQLRQQAEKEEIKAQYEAMKLNELRELEKLKEKARLEDIEELKKIKEKREKFKSLLKQQIAEHEAVLTKQNEIDASIDRHIAETANQDLTNELIQQKKRMEEGWKEMLYYKEYMQELKKERLQEDKRIDELIEEQRKYLDRLQVEKICQGNKAREQLTKQVLEQRKLQVEAKEKVSESQKELQVFEAQLAEKKRLENLYSEEKEVFKMARLKNNYAIELKQQIEQIKQMREKEQEEADRILKKGMIDEKDYLQKAEEIMNKRISKKVHPFFVAVSDKGIPTDCKINI